MRLYFILFVAIWSLGAYQEGCKRKSKDHTEAGGSATEVRSADFLLKKIKEKEPKTPTTFTSRLSIDTDEISASGNLIWVKDSLIWFNVKKFGFEAARGLITKDSVYLLNRLEKTATIKSLEWISYQYNIPAEFGLLEGWILGKGFYFKDATYQTLLSDGKHQINGTNGKFALKYLVEDGSYLLKQMLFMEQKEAKSVQFDFGAPANISNLGVLLLQRNIAISSEATGNLSAKIDFSDIEVNGNYPYKFEIPSSYKRIY